MKNKIALLLFCILFILINSLRAQEYKTKTRSEVHSFNELIGTWNCKGLNRNNDGSWRTDTTSGTWVWFHLFEGNAVQDIFYGGVNPNQVDTASKGGTNIRIYNEKENRWNMAWLDTNNKIIEVFTAVGDRDKIVMDGINAQGRHVQNYFTEISDNSFTWTQYWTFDEGKTWIDVAILWCTKVNM